MCGIAGVLNHKEQLVDPELVSRMTRAIAHRGPDGEGTWVEKHIGLGHRRLAIIDLTERAKQPMHTQDGRYVISYNGELYNFKELKKQLLERNYIFKSESDTEVILNAFAEWGVDAVSKFNGMFAFAIWDKLEKSLFICRDRYGIKPLYYTQTNNNFYFASEFKAFLTLPDFEKEVDQEALLEYFTFQNLFTDRTLLKGTKLLPPGNIFKVKATSGGIEIQQKSYWDFSFSENLNLKDSREVEEEVRRLFIQSVKRQLVTDVEIGSYLSGGMDSGSITAVAAKENPFIKSFTCGFDLRSASGIELTFDERAKSEYMSYLFKTEHYEMVLKAGDMERCLPKLAWHIEEPRVGQSYPNYYAAKLSSKFVKVVLSGAGGDELFGGYPWRYYRAAVNQNFEDYIDKYYVFWQRLIPNAYLKELFKPIWSNVSHVWTRDIFRDVFKNHANQLECPEDYINHSMYFEAKTFLHGLLVVDDKLSMAHGLETRVSFLDNDLVDFATRIPVRMKLNNLQEVIKINENNVGDKPSQYFQKTKDGKQILRDVMRQFIPDEIVNAEKQGFSAPDGSWFKGESIEFVKQTLSDENAPIYRYLDRNSVYKIVEEHLSGKQNRRLFIWSLLNVNQFLKEFIG